jgi:hypothetical protein
VEHGLCLATKSGLLAVVAPLACKQHETTASRSTTGLAQTSPDRHQLPWTTHPCMRLAVAAEVNCGIRHVLLALQACCCRSAAEHCFL